MLKKNYDCLTLENIDLREKDYLNNFIYAENLSKIIIDYLNSPKDKPIYISLTGAWGSGKTTVVETAMKMVKEEIDADVIKYNAWKYEGNSFRRSFVRTVLDNSFSNKNNTFYKKQYNKLYDDKNIEVNSIKDGVELRKKVLKELPLKKVMLVVIFITVFITVMSIFLFNKFAGLYSTVMSIIGIGGFSYIIKNGWDIVSKMLSTKVTYSFQKLFSPEQFYDILGEIFNYVKKENRIILIDNIDRCEVSELKDTVRSLKGLLIDNCKIIYIIPFDAEQFSKAYENDYNSYSEKVFDYSIDLKEKTQKNVIDFVYNLIESNKDYSYLFINDVINVIALSGNKTPRQILNICNDYIIEYNLFVAKNNFPPEKISNEILSYLMKYSIIKKYHSTLFKFAHIDIESIKELEDYAYNRWDFKTANDKFVWINEETYTFLRKTKNIKPIEYDMFYSSDTKDDFYIDSEILNLIQSEDYETIVSKINSGNINVNTIINYLKKSVMYDNTKKTWKTAIAPKFRLIIYLIKKDVLEIKSIVRDFKFLIVENEFIKELICTREISSEEIIFFMHEMQKNKCDKYHIAEKVLAEVVNNSFNFREENEKLNFISNLFSSIEYKLEENRQYQFFSNHINYLIDQKLFSNEIHINVFTSPNIKHITVDQIKKILLYSDSNHINSFVNTLNIIHNLDEKSYTTELITNYVNFINKNYSYAVDAVFINETFKFIEHNLENPLLNVGVRNINVPAISKAYFSNQLIDSVLKIYRATKYINFRNILLSIAEHEHKLYLITEISKIDNYDNDFFDFSKSVSDLFDIHELKTVINLLVNMFEKYNVEQQKSFYEYIYLKNEEIVCEFYSAIKSHSQKEEFAQYIISRESNFDKKIKMIDIYTSSSERFEELINSQNNFTKLESIFQLVNQSYGILLIKRFTFLINTKTSIVNEDFTIIKKIITNKNITKKSIKDILSSIGLNKVSTLDLKELYNSLNFSETIKTEYNLIKSYLTEMGEIITDKENSNVEETV